MGWGKSCRVGGRVCWADSPQTWCSLSCRSAQRSLGLHALTLKPPPCPVPPPYACAARCYSPLSGRRCSTPTTSSAARQAQPLHAVQHAWCARLHDQPATEAYCLQLRMAAEVRPAWLCLAPCRRAWSQQQPCWERCGSRGVGPATFVAALPVALPVALPCHQRQLSSNAPTRHTLSPLVLFQLGLSVKDMFNFCMAPASAADLRLSAALLQFATKYRCGALRVQAPDAEGWNWLAGGSAAACSECCEMQQAASAQLAAPCSLPPDAASFLPAARAYPWRWTSLCPTGCQPALRSCGTWRRHTRWGQQQHRAGAAGGASKCHAPASPVLERCEPLGMPTQATRFVLAAAMCLAPCSLQ